MEDDPSANHIGIQIMILVVLTLINAFFACAEMAMVSVNKSKIRKLAGDGKKSAKLVLKFLMNPQDFYRQFRLQSHWQASSPVLLPQQVFQTGWAMVY